MSSCGHLPAGASIHMAAIAVSTKATAASQYQCLSQVAGVGANLTFAFEGDLLVDLVALGPCRQACIPYC